MNARSLIAGLLLCAPAAQAATLEAECETRLALSALPDHLQADARVMLPTEGGFTAHGDADATFTCVVERNHPQSLIPQCMDRAGAETILPAILWKTERILAGSDPAAVRDEHAERLARGEWQAPARPGVSYMVSGFTRVWLAAQNQLIDVAPHVMFYAPGLANDDIGGSHEQGMAHRGLPFVLDEGPHGYMISYVDGASDRAPVAAACGAQLASLSAGG